MAGPLEGIRVVDLSRDVAGPFATKLLADYGADVIKVEPPDGDPSRRSGPFHGDDPHPEKSALFLHLNTNKRSITLDPASTAGAALVRRLAADADVLVEDFEPGRSAGWGWEALTADRQDLVMASLTPFGQTGPYRDYRGAEITLQAIGGPMLVTGHREKEPLKLGGHAAHYHAGTAAAFAIMLARLRVESGGEGDYIDLAVFECQAGTRDRRTIFQLGAAYTGFARSRPVAGTRPLSGVRPCADGYVSIMGGRRVGDLVRMIGRDDLLDHPDIGGPASQLPPELVEEIEQAYMLWLLQQTMHDAIARAQEFHMLSGAILTIEDLLADPHYRDRGAFDVIDHPFTGPVEYPGRQLVMSASPRPTPRRAPLLGEHNVDVYCGELGLDRGELALLREQGVV